MMIERAVHGRNGLPGLRPYAYRGTGQDTLTPPAVMHAWHEVIRAAGGQPAADRGPELEQRIAVEQALALGQVPPRVGPPVANGRRRAPDGPRIGRVASPPQWCPSCGYMAGSQGCAISCR